MDFSITNYKSYTPIKVINITNQGTKAIYTFVGNTLNDTVKKILENENERDLIPKDEKILEKEYGTHWRQILGFPKAIGRQRFASSQFSYSSDSLFDSVASDIESIPDVIEKVQKTIERRTGLNFVFEFINQNDSIEMIKKKIYAYTNIPVISQHIFYKRDNPVLKGAVETIVLDYKVIDLYAKFRIIPINIQEAIKPRNPETAENIAVPIDKHFAENANKYLIRNTLFTLLADFEGFNNEIFLADINSFIPSINKTYFTNSEEIYKGYILKYFPSISASLVKPILNNTYVPPEQPNTIKRDILQIQKQINLINSLELPVKKINLDILSIIININYPQEINITNIKTSNDLLILRNIFELLETNENMPYIRNIQKNKIKTKVDKKFYNTNLSLVRRNWMTAQESAGLIIKLRLSDDPKDPRYSKFISIVIYADGKMDIKITFPLQMNIPSEKMITDVIKKIEIITDTINKHRESFIKPLSKLHIINIKVANISSIYYPDILSEMSPNDYAMLQCFLKTFNSYIISDHEVQRGNMAVSVRFINKTFVSGERIKKSTNEMISTNEVESIQKSIYSTSTNIEISQSPAKIVIKGSGNTMQTNRLLNFIERFFYYFRHPDANEYIKTIYELCYKRLPANMREAEGGEGGLEEPEAFGYTSKGSRRIKILKDADPRTFNFKPTKKFDPYSKKCQQTNQQPLVYTDEQFNKLKTKPKNDSLIRLKNKTRPNTYLNYVCDNNVFQYPGFLTKDQHPDGICMPCCYRTNSRINPSQKKYKKFQQCLKEEDPDNAETPLTTNDAKIPSFKSYITSWKANEIEEGRFSKIPYQLSDLFNVDNECKIPNNLLVAGSSCFLISGFAQTINSFIKSVSACFDDDLKTSDLIKMLLESPDLFNILEHGEVKKRFITFKNFVEYLNNNIETISDIYLKDLLSIKYNVHIAIFTYEFDDITITCSPNLDAVGNQDTIIIIKAPKSDFTTFYYPVWKVAIEEQKKIFSPQSHTSITIGKLYYSLCHDIIKAQQSGIMFDAQFIAKMAKITGQVVEKERPKYLIINNSFSIPVNIDSYKLPNVPIVKEPVLGNINDVSAFLEELQDHDAIYVKKDARVINETKNAVIGYFLNTNYFVPVKPFKITHILPNDYVMPKIKSVSTKSIETVPPHKKLSEQDAKERTEYKNYVKDITIKLNIERNNDILNKIKNIIKKYPENNAKNFKIISDLFEKLDIAPEDAQELIQILFETYSNKNLSFMDILSRTRFNFDDITKNELINATDKITITKIIKQLTDKNVSSDFQNRIIQEILSNDYQRFNILHNTEIYVSPLRRKNELIFIQ